MKFSEELDKILEPLPVEFVSAGLVFTGMHENIDSNGSKFARFAYENKQSLVKLEISISEKNGSLSVFISHPNKGGFGLQDFLVHRKRQQEYENIFFPAPIARYIELVRGLVANEWHDVILGKKWEDIPFDWDGYK
jgi:hypothetical protein